MDSFFKFLGEHPAVLATILALISILVVAVIWAMVWATRNGSDFTFWIFRIRGRKVVADASNLKIELGSEDTQGHSDFYENIQKKPRPCSVQIEYKQIFKKPPQVFVALKKIDVGGSLTSGPWGHIQRLRVKTDHETEKGFTLIFETWDDSVVYAASASWIAVGE